MPDLHKMARLLRFSSVKSFLNAGLLDDGDALELLNAPLSETETEIFDDREMLKWDSEQIKKWLEE